MKIVRMDESKEKAKLMLARYEVNYEDPGNFIYKYNYEDMNNYI